MCRAVPGCPHPPLARPAACPRRGRAPGPAAPCRRRVRRSACGTSSAASSCSWVAHAVESAVTIELAVGQPLRLGVRGEVRPDDLRPPAEHRAGRHGQFPARVGDQAVDAPRRAAQGRPCGLAAAPDWPPAARSKAHQLFAENLRQLVSAGARLWPAHRPSPAPGPGPRARLDRSPAGCRNLGHRSGWSAGTFDHPALHRVARAGRGEPRRHVGRDRGGDQDLLGVGRPARRAGHDGPRRVRRTRRRASAPGLRRRRAAGRTRPAAARARATTTRRDWRSPARAARRSAAQARRGAGRPGRPRARARRGAAVRATARRPSASLAGSGSGSNTADRSDPCR